MPPRYWLRDQALVNVQVRGSLTQDRAVGAGATQQVCNSNLEFGKGLKHMELHITLFIHRYRKVYH